MRMKPFDEDDADDDDDDAVTILTHRLSVFAPNQLPVLGATTTYTDAK